MKPSDLHVILVHSNPVRYRVRPQLHRRTQEELAAAGVTVWVVEATFGERGPEVASPHNPRHIILRCDDEIWLKEAMINVAAKALPASARYVMWMDADISFVNPDWASETLEALQHFRVVQPWSHCIDLGPEGETMLTHQGFCYLYDKGHRHIPGAPGYPFMHPGYAWAFRREAFEALGGMIDWAICGSGDHHMAAGLIGLSAQTVHGEAHPSFKAMVQAWEDNAQAMVKRDIGHVPGTILHHFHGWKADRRYQSRWEILTRNAYDPSVDLVREADGLPRLAGNKTGLRDDLRRYFRERVEDAGRRSWPS